SRSSKYIALSYCWGGNQTFKLTSSTIEELYAGFKISALPKTIRDAITITKWFKIKYLWVDALCIIQGDANDWIQQAPLMEKVYRGSFLTIAAQGAKDTTEAWTVQERLLCPRILYFGALLKWECCENMEWEFPNRYHGYSESENIKRFLFSDTLIHTTSPDDSGFQILAKYWANITHMYSLSNITVTSDRTVALHGVMKHMEGRTGYENLAGLWRPILLSQLLWYLDNDVNEFSSPGSKEFVPSWSWLGMNEEVKYS
ncbi:heterokaryon incompatibility protein-domain-containing protein, partial [Tricladium varicosporioides]